MVGAQGIAVSGRPPHRMHIMCRSHASVSSGDVQRWRTRALRCMGMHADSTSGARLPGQPCDRLCLGKLLTHVDGFSKTSVFQHMNFMRNSQSRFGKEFTSLGSALPGILWLPDDVFSVMIAQEQVDELEMSECIKCWKPVSVSVPEPAVARAWFASIFQMQHLAAELHILRTSAPNILHSCAGLVKELQERGDHLSQSRIAGLARLLQTLLLPTSRSALSIGALCKEPISQDRCKQHD
eukprot:jgi/Ulvmu1/4378/UM002_0103.1